MASVNVLVLRAPGTNCDGETCHAFERVGGRPVRVHVNALVESPRQLADYQMLVLPGGFCYGDDVAAGKILANQLRRRLGDAMWQFRDSGKLILGICNGFQVLIKSGLLPGWNDHGVEDESDQPATLATNDTGRFEDRWIHLAADPGPCVFLLGISRLDLPIAHGEGKFVGRDDAVLERLRSNRQLVLNYSAVAVQPAAAVAQPSSLNPQPSSNLPYPLNPNGSQLNIAGICDPTGRVFGLMPHPERHIDPTQHPQWTRRHPATEGDGLAIFRNAVAYFQ